MREVLTLSVPPDLAREFNIFLRRLQALDTRAVANLSKSRLGTVALQEYLRNHEELVSQAIEDDWPPDQRAELLKSLGLL